MELFHIVSLLKVYSLLFAGFILLADLLDAEKEIAIVRRVGLALQVLLQLVEVLFAKEDDIASEDGIVALDALSRRIEDAAHCFDIGTLLLTQEVILALVFVGNRFPYQCKDIIEIFPYRIGISCPQFVIVHIEYQDG